MSPGRRDRLLWVDDAETLVPVTVEAAGGRAVAFSTAAPYKRDEDWPNEDSACVLPAGAASTVFAVADGLGGLPGGASASRLALEVLDEGIVRASAASNDSLRAPILDAFEVANARVREQGIGAATTLVVAELCERRLRTYHVGDSSAWVVGQRGKLKLQTLAHSPTGYGLEAGLIDEREALEHEERHVVSNALGSSDMRIEVGSPIDLAPRDTVLLASDGLFDNLSQAEIVDHIRSGPLEESAAELLQHAQARMQQEQPGTKQDDLTFILYRQS